MISAMQTCSKRSALCWAGLRKRATPVHDVEEKLMWVPLHAVGTIQTILEQSYMGCTKVKLRQSMLHGVRVPESRLCAHGASAPDTQEPARKFVLGSGSVPGAWLECLCLRCCKLRQGCPCTEASEVASEESRVSSLAAAPALLLVPVHNTRIIAESVNPFRDRSVPQVA